VDYRRCFNKNALSSTAKRFSPILLQFDPDSDNWQKGELVYREIVLVTGVAGVFNSLGRMLLRPMGNRETQIRFKMQKDGEPVWDQSTIDRLWVTTQREAMIESGPPPATSSAATQQGANSSDQKAKEPAKK
jgi:hypothetical protein